MNSQPTKGIRIYKYLDLDGGIKTLKSNTMKVSKLSELNDVFEWRAGVLAKFIADPLDWHVKMIEFVEKQEEIVGIISFSETISEPLLWAHYADKHRGLAIELHHGISKDGPIQIEYSDLRPTLDHSLISDPGYLAKTGNSIIEKTLTSKSLAWNYEQEWRIMTGKDFWRVVDGVRVVDTPPGMISRVIMGCRCQMDPAELREILNSAGLKGVEIWVALPHISEYKITIHRTSI